MTEIRHDFRIDVTAALPPGAGSSAWQLTRARQEFPWLRAGSQMVQQQASKSHVVAVQGLWRCPFVPVSAPSAQCVVRMSRVPGVWPLIPTLRAVWTAGGGLRAALS